jgi:hypothetical protein
MNLAVGFRVKSGYAVAVTLSGPASAPAAVARKLVELCDPEQADTRQPYHHDFYTHEEDRRELARRTRIVRRCAKHSVDRLLEEMRASFSAPKVRAALVVGSVIVEKELAARAAHDLKRPDRDITRTVAAFGKVLGGPWRAEEKAASAAAWMALARA